MELIEGSLVLVGGDGYVPVRFFPNVIGEALGTFGLAVNDEEPFWGLFKFAQPVEKLISVGVGRETVDSHDVCFDRIVLAEDSDLFFAVNNLSA